jgi:choline kinase
MKVINLVAGICSRLKPLTNTCHKSLLDINGKSLLTLQLDAFSASGIDEMIFIVGYNAESIISQFGGKYHGMRLKYIYNPEYRTKSLDYSLYLAKNYVAGEKFIYFEGDVLFHRSILTNLLNSKFSNCLTVDPSMQSELVDTLVCGEQNLVKKITFVDHGNFRDSDIASVGELIPMIKFNEVMSSLIFDRLSKTDFKSIQLFNIINTCSEIEKLHYIEIKKLPWVEIDTPDDLIRARKLWVK